MFPAATTNRLGGAAHDERGNVSAYDGFTYTYDALNMTQTIHSDASNPVKDLVLLYTADDERVMTFDTVSGMQSWTVRDLQGKILTELNAGTAKFYIYRDNVLIGISEPSNIPSARYVGVDHLGTPRVFTSNEPSWPSLVRKFYPFGEEIGCVDSYDLRFTGQQRDFPCDAKAQDNFHAREYHPFLGRFLSVDAHIGKSQSPQSWNRYAYARNNPIKFIDPDGQDAIIFIVAHAGARSAWGHSAIYVTRGGKGDGISYLGASNFGRPGSSPQKAIDQFVRGYTSMGRSVTAYTLKTTPSEDAKMMSFIAANRETGGTNPSLVPKGLEFRQNCTTACYNVARAGGLLTNFFNPEGFGAHTPDELESALKDPESELGKRVYNVVHYPGGQASFYYPGTGGLALLFGGTFWVEGVQVNMAPPK